MRRRICHVTLTSRVCEYTHKTCSVTVMGACASRGRCSCRHPLHNHLGTHSRDLPRSNSISSSEMAGPPTAGNPDARIPQQQNKAAGSEAREQNVDGNDSSLEATKSSGSLGFFPNNSSSPGRTATAAAGSTAVSPPINLTPVHHAPLHSALQACQAQSLTAPHSTVSTTGNSNFSVTPSADEVSPALSTQTSKLEDAQRRRLSVSTVRWTTESSGDACSASGISVSHPSSPCGTAEVLCKSNANATAELKSSFNEHQNSNQSVSDPALALLNAATGTIRDVTLPMLLNLLNPKSASLLIFGAPCQGVQRGFDNKQIEVAGTLAPTYNVTENGIGYACKKGLKPESPNQDDFFIVKVDDWSLYGVFDGHGPYGHNVSSFIHRVLPFLIIGDPKFETDPLLVMRQCFRKAHHLLEAMCEEAANGIDCTLSGTTGTVILHRDKRFYVAHVGDSRAVLSTKYGGRLKAVNLTVDHKPTCEEERRRLESCGGDVRRLEGDIPYRVFVKNRMYPGLAMSRAIGDTVGVEVGVIPDPDVRVVEINEEDQFIIISTDGVWEFISSQEAVDFVCQKTRAEVQKAAEFLAYESWRRWVEEEENVVDDVTCVIVWVAASAH